MQDCDPKRREVSEVSLIIILVFWLKAFFRLCCRKFHWIEENELWNEKILGICKGWGLGGERASEICTKGKTRTNVVAKPAFGPHFQSGKSLWHIRSMLGLGPVHNKRLAVGTSLVVQWLRIHRTVQGTQVWFRVRELRSHMLWGN